MKLVITGQLPGENEIIEASKAHWSVYRDMKEDYTNLVAWSAKSQNVQNVQSASFIITWVEPNRKRDKDNIAAGAKFIFDGLVTAGVLKNDGWKQIGDVNHRYDVDKLNPRVEVEIIEIKEVSA